MMPACNDVIYHHSLAEPYDNSTHPHSSLHRLHLRHIQHFAMGNVLSTIAITAVATTLTAHGRQLCEWAECTVQSEPGAIRDRQPFRALKKKDIFRCCAKSANSNEDLRLVLPMNDQSCPDYGHHQHREVSTQCDCSEPQKHGRPAGSTCRKTDKGPKVITGSSHKMVERNCLIM